VHCFRCLYLFLDGWLGFLEENSERLVCCLLFDLGWRRGVSVFLKKVDRGGVA